MSVARPEGRLARQFTVSRAEFGGGAIDCTVRNLSDIGAALDVTSPPRHLRAFHPVRRG